MRYRRRLAIGTLVVQVCVVLFSLPFGLLYFLIPIARLAIGLSLLSSLYISLALGVLANTGTLLTIVASTLAMVVASRRGQRQWFIALLVLLLLSAYSPTFSTWIRYNPPTFTVIPAALYLIILSPQMLSLILAVVVLVYCQRYRQAAAASSQERDATLEIGRSRIDS